jgi:hypothetical protein
LMVRDRASGRFVYVEQMERRRGETPWEYTDAASGERVKSGSSIRARRFRY